MRYATALTCAAMMLGLIGCGANNDKTAMENSKPGAAAAPPPSQDAYLKQAQQGASGGGNPYGKKSGS